MNIRTISPIGAIYVAYDVCKPVSPDQSTEMRLAEWEMASVEALRTTDLGRLQMEFNVQNHCDSSANKTTIWGARASNLLKAERDTCT